MSPLAARLSSCEGLVRMAVPSRSRPLVAAMGSSSLRPRRKAFGVIDDPDGDPQTERVVAEVTVARVEDVVLPLVGEERIEDGAVRCLWENEDAEALGGVEGLLSRAQVNWPAALRSKLVELSTPKMLAYVRPLLPVVPGVVSMVRMFRRFGSVLVLSTTKSPLRLASPTRRQCSQA